MRLYIASIGRLKAGAEKTLADDYADRINAMGKKAGISNLKIGEWPESQNATADQRMRDEAQILWAAVPAAATTIVLDERGKSL